MSDILILPLIAAALAAIACGSVGTLTLVRRNTYVAGAVSHSVLAGLGLAQFLSVVHRITWFTPTFGAILAAIAAALAIVYIQSGKQGDNDAALSAVWAVGMAMGMGFMSITPGYQADLMNYMFGSILLVSPGDVQTMFALDVFIAIALAFCWRGILSVSFNNRLASARGVKTTFFETVISILTAIAVVLLVKIVGIVLVIALLTLPAMAARNLFRRLVPMMAAAMIIAFASMAIGIGASWYGDLQPAAPIVLSAALFAVITHAVKCLLQASRIRNAKHLADATSPPRFSEG